MTAILQYGGMMRGVDETTPRDLIAIEEESGHSQRFMWDLYLLVVVVVVCTLVLSIGYLGWDALTLQGSSILGHSEWPILAAGTVPCETVPYRLVNLSRQVS